METTNKDIVNKIREAQVVIANAQNDLKKFVTDK